MLNEFNIENILYLDIETVPLKPEFSSLDEKSKELWDKKSSYFRKENETAEDVYQRAGIYAEFGKIICISVGHIISQNGEYKVRIKSFFGDDEKALLVDFSNMLNKFSSRTDAQLCAHNGKEFDFPYIARRMLVNGIKLPVLLDIAGKKPWEVKHLDTLELWKFGDYKNYTSLELLTSIFNIPSPKDDIDGSMIAEVYYQEKNIDRIVRYCEKDVLAVIQLILKYRGENLVKEEDIEKVN